MKISARTERKEYERRIAPRGLVRILGQKLLHQWARGCIPAGPRLWLYRRMGIRIGQNVFVGLDTDHDSTSSGRLEPCRGMSTGRAKPSQANGFSSALGP